MSESEFHQLPANWPPVGRSFGAQKREVRGEKSKLLTARPNGLPLETTPRVLFVCFIIQRVTCQAAKAQQAASSRLICSLAYLNRKLSLWFWYFLKAFFPSEGWWVLFAFYRHDFSSTAMIADCHPPVPTTINTSLECASTSSVIQLLYYRSSTTTCINYLYRRAWGVVRLEQLERERQIVHHLKWFTSHFLHTTGLRVLVCYCKQRLLLMEHVGLFNNNCKPDIFNLKALSQKLQNKTKTVDSSELKPLTVFNQKIFESKFGYLLILSVC